MYLCKRFIFSITILSFFILFANRSHAQEPDFFVEQEITYDCANLEFCAVSNDITLTNNNKNYFAEDFILQTSLKNIYDTQAFLEKEPLLTELEEKNGEKLIRAKFPKAMVGIGSKISFNIKFKASGLVQRSGNSVEVSAPAIRNSHELSNAKITILLPKNLGKPVKYTPYDNSYETEDNFVVEYKKENSIEKNIYAMFGNEQTYLYELTYYLENKNPIFPKTYQVALVPDIEDYQKSYISFISELPKNATIDQEGNYLVSYNLRPKETKQIAIYGFVTIFINQTPVMNPKQPTANLSYLTKPKKYWEFENTKIQKVFGALDSLDKTYTFLTENFEYSYKKSEEGSLRRMGIIKALENPSDLVCMDFADLGISILRSHKIPAREIVGFAYSGDIAKRPVVIVGDGDKNLRHSWLEYYKNGEGWKQMDPTWGRTSGIDYLTGMDLNHIALMRNPFVGYLEIPPYKMRFSVANSADTEKAKPTLQALEFKKETKTSKIILGILLTPLLYMSFVVLKALLDARKK